MRFVLCRCSDTLRNVGEELESGQLLNVADFHILPLRTTILMIKQVSGTHGRHSLSAGEMYLHDALEILRSNRADRSGLVLRRAITTSEDRARHDIERIIPTRGATDALDIPFQRRPNPAIETAQLRSHVREIGRLPGLVDCRATVIGRDLMPTGIGAALSESTGKIPTEKSA